MFAFKILAAWLVTLGLVAQVSAQAPKPDPTDEVFQPKGALPRIKVTLDELNLKLLRQDPRKYVRGTVVIDDQTFQNVGIHVKGAAGSSRDWNDKPALTVNFDKFTKGQNWKGLDKIHLNNSVQDPTYLNEILCSELARAMGLPTARAAQATVELNGRKVGLYVVKEGYNAAFVKRTFPTAATGNLYDGGFLQDIDGNLKLDTGTDNKLADVKLIAKACQIGDANKRYEEVSKLVDVDKFVTNAALQILGTDWDGYMRNRNNYRLYIPTTGGKAVLIPHGMDQMFGNPGEGLWHGWGGMMARAILDHPEGKKKTFAKLKEMIDNHFKPDKINARIDEWVKRGKEGLEKQNKDWAKDYENQAKAEKDRIKQRYDYIVKELPKLMK
jgi:spore coat protein H